MELLAPCSSKETFYAALNAGADAIYLGGKNFSARAYAENFSLAEIEECIDKAHAVDVKVYITVNTLLFEDEFEECLKECEKYIAMGVDALIIQDLGLINKLHKLYPSFPLHASTQLNVHNLDEARMLKKLGVVRVVLAREANLEMAKLINDKLHLEVEVFVHGALCVSCSGQCLMSSFIGKRSGNRGKCAQPCRLEGKIVTNDKIDNAINYPLSMKDLCTIDHIDKFFEYGICSLKIEGRMKNKEYIYQVVKAYKERLNNLDLDLSKRKEKIKTAFYRGYTKGFILDEANNRTLNQNSSSHIGVTLGKVSKIGKNSFFMILETDLDLHDGLRDTNSKEGFLLTHFKFKGNDVHHAKKGDYVEIISPLKGIKVNDVIVKTKSKALEDEVNFAIKEKRTIDINAYFYAHENQEMVLTLYDDSTSMSVNSDCKLEKSKSVFNSREDLANRLNKSDIYPFNITHIEFDIEPGLYYPLKDINALRRNAFKGFYEEKIKSFKNKHRLHEETINKLSNLETMNEIVSVEKEEQLNVVLNYPFSKIYVPYLLYSKYKDKDDRILLQKKRMGIDKAKVDDALSPYLSCDAKILSPYANITNHEALNAALQNNYKGVILSYELSFDNAVTLKNKFMEKYSCEPNIFYPIYGHVDYMILKSCPIATSKKQKVGCGLCKKNQYYYQDRMGVKYPIVSDEECYVRVLSNLPLSLINKKEKIKQHFIPYLVFTIENEEQTKEVLDAYFDLEIEYYEHMDGHFYKSPL